MKYYVAIIHCVLLVSTSAFSFSIISSEGKSLKWQDNEVEYYINERGSDDFVNGFDSNGEAISEFDIINNSFKTWQDVAGTNLNVVYEGLTSIAETKIDKKNVIFWVEQGWTSLDFHPPRGALAVTISSFDLKNGKILDADILLNGEYFKWADIDTDPETLMVDVQNTTTHEIGHLFGLDHSSNDPFEDNESIRTATMYYATNPGITDGRSLEVDDILGLKHLYAKNVDQIPIPTIDGITPASGDNSSFVVLTTQGGKNFAETSLLRLVPHEDGLSDVIAKEVSVDGGEITSLFDLRGVKIGIYDVVVANAYGKEAKLEKAFEVKGNPNVYYNRSKVSYVDGGGCGLLNSGHESNASWIMILTLLCFGIFVRRHVNSQKP